MVLCKELPTIEITNQRITYMNTTNFQIPVAVFQYHNLVVKVDIDGDI